MIRALAIALALIAAPAAAQERVLRICADPNNLPFSNAAGEGFENQIAGIVAEELGAKPQYVWWAQRRGFIRNTLNAGECDLVPGVAAGMEMLATTQPYYRSTYVFVTRKDRGLDIAGFDDPRLKTLTIGVQMVGDDFSNTPPAHALARRQITDNVRGYLLYGDYAEPSPPHLIVQAVARGEVDVAIVWGPLAGYFADKEGADLALKPVYPVMEAETWPMTFDIAMGVRRSDKDLLAEVNAALEKRKPQIDAVLAQYGVPRAD